MNRVLAFCCLFVVAACCPAEDPSLPQSKDNLHLFLLVGQSNMAGRGEVTKVDPPIDSRILMLNQSNEWVVANDPLHFDKPRVVGVGLGRSFASKVREANPEITIGLVPCAVGGSSISIWVPGGYHTQTKSHPWDDMTARLRIAMKSGTVKGILWHQGEGDSKSAASKTYEAKLHSLVARLREEIGDNDVPFIAGQLGQFKDRPWTEGRKRVNAAHESLPSKIERTAFVRSDGLVHKGDMTHFSADSYREFGRRFAKAFATLAVSKQGSKVAP